MVDVGDKPVSLRKAVARGRIQMQAETLQRIIEGDHKKGDVLGIARIAAIMASKRTAELLVHQAAKQSGRPYVTVRFGNVLGSRGSVIPVFQEQIASGGPVTVTHQQATRYFMTIKEAAMLVVQGMAGGSGGSRARRFNQDAAFQIAAGIQKMFFTRPAVSHRMGSIDSGITYSLHALLLTNDLVGMLRRLWNGVTVDDERRDADGSRVEGPRTTLHRDVVGAVR